MHIQLRQSSHLHIIVNDRTGNNTRLFYDSIFSHFKLLHISIVAGKIIAGNSTNLGIQGTQQFPSASDKTLEGGT